MKNIKTVILDLIIEEVAAQIKNAEYGLLAAIEESKAHKGAMESRYDTFKEEAQSLAEGFRTQLSRLGQTLSALKSIKDYPRIITKGSGYALIEARNLDDGTMSKYFLLPAGGGNTYEVEGEEITVLSVGAPMARAFIDAVAGDKVEIKLPKTTKQFIIVSVE